MNRNEAGRRFPLYGWFGLALLILFWYLNWFLTGLRTNWAFFPLWLGFCLSVDGLVFIRCGTSLLKRDLKKFISLFIISAPVWWLFELFNSLTHNWVYDGRQYFTDFQFFILASVSFSTVIPSVFEAAELAGSFKFIKDTDHLRELKPTGFTQGLFIALGLLTLLLEILFPDIFYPLIWITVFFLIEPVNIKLKNNSLLKFTERGDWEPVFSLFIGALICAFFWEMWNYYSYPKWHYNLPMVNFVHIFEMPILGYIGYLPFSLELFAVYNLIVGIFGDKSGDYIKLVP